MFVITRYFHKLLPDHEKAAAFADSDFIKFLKKENWSKPLKNSAENHHLIGKWIEETDNKNEKKILQKLCHPISFSISLSAHLSAFLSLLNGNCVIRLSDTLVSHDWCFPPWQTSAPWNTVNQCFYSILTLISCNALNVQSTLDVWLCI